MTAWADRMEYPAAHAVMFLWKANFLFMAMVLPVPYFQLLIRQLTHYNIIKTLIFSINMLQLIKNILKYKRG